MKRLNITFRSLLPTAFLVCAAVSANAQTTNSMYFLEQTAVNNKLNPALTADRTYVGAGITNMGLSVYSDLAYSDIFKPNESTGKLDWFLNSSVDANDWLEGVGDLSNFSVKTDIDILNMGMKIGKNFLTLNAGIHTDMGMGIPKDFLKFFVLGMDESASSATFNMTDMNVSAFMYGKFGIGLSRKFGNISVGITANYLQGIADMQMGFDQLTMTTSSGKVDVVSKGYCKLAAPDIFSLQYGDDGYLSGINTPDNFSDVAGMATSLQKCGSGLSFDAGVSAKVLDFLTVSAAVTDLGSIKWSKDAINMATANGTFEWTGQDFQDESDNNGITDQFAEMIHFTKEENAKAYVTKLTTKINLAAEASFLNEHLSLGLLSQSGIAENGNYQNFMVAANLKPTKSLQAALTYSSWDGKSSALGAAINAKLLFFNWFMAADFIPMKVTPQFIPVNNLAINFQTGLNFMF
jgi:hypothetical protein